MKLWMKLVPQILKETVNTLYNCKATFELNVSKCTLLLWNVERFTLDESNQQDPMYGIVINTENNTKVLYIHKDNLLEFTTHLNT